MSAPDDVGRSCQSAHDNNADAKLKFNLPGSIFVPNHPARALVVGIAGDYFHPIAQPYDGPDYPTCASRQGRNAARP